MQGYFIDAGRRLIEPIEYEYRTLRNFLPGGSTIAAVFPDGDVLLVDDEGLTHPARVAFIVKARPDGQPMMSNGVLTGRDDVNTTLPPVMTIAELAEQIEWIDVETALDWYRQRRADPAVTVSGSDGSFEVLSRWGDYLPMLEGREEQTRRQGGGQAT